jgi:dTDP-4-dehydrorhamnose 3,5-epimerase
MEFTALELPGAYLIEEESRRDARGDLSRIFCAREFAEHGLESTFVQVNRSRTFRRGTVRGLHYQIPPATEAKLFRCLRGSLLHVMVDMRRGSRSFLRWHAEVLTGDGGRMVYVPRGVAHAMQALEDDVETMYSTTTHYAPEHERGCRYDDPRIGIAWPIAPPQAILSDKDRAFPLLGSDFEGVHP